MFIIEPGPIPYPQFILGLVFLFVVTFVPLITITFIIFRNKWNAKKIIIFSVILALILESIFVGYQMYRLTKVVY